jgi:hypothetical protein
MKLIVFEAYQSKGCIRPTYYGMTVERCPFKGDVIHIGWHGYIKIIRLDRRLRSLDFRRLDIEITNLIPENTPKMALEEAERLRDIILMDSDTLGKPYERSNKH